MIKFTILFALVAAASADFGFDPLNPLSRIVGGVATSIEDVPYQVSILAFGSHLCGGSIIADNWVLTAAHCMVYRPNVITVRSGSSSVSSGGVISVIDGFANHPNYRTTLFGIPHHDIAIIRLSSALTLDSTTAVIGLFDAGEESPVGALAVITGWGRLAEGGSSPDVLQTVTIPIISKADCRAAYRRLPDGQICAAVPEGGLDACQGDSGGPLAIDGRLAGVVSWGRGCARAGNPGAYTEVSAYRTWINGRTGV